MNTRHRLLAGAALVVCASAAWAPPASAAHREHQQMMADIRMLQEQNQQIQLTLTSSPRR